MLAHHFSDSSRLAVFLIRSPQGSSLAFLPWRQYHMQAQLRQRLTLLQESNGGADHQVGDADCGTG